MKRSITGHLLQCKTHKGVFELADGGTLVLEEIGEMPLTLQSKLLTVLDERRVRRVGGSTWYPFNIKLIATTNRNIEGMLNEHKFRKDLFYRLSVVNIHIPPLRERSEDIPMLCEEILRQLVGNSAPTLGIEELERLQSYSWPGNTRELRNLLERSLLIQRDGKFAPSEFLGKLVTPPLNPVEEDGWEPLSMSELELQHIRRTLRHCDNVKSRAAKLLGISRSSINRKLGLA